MLIGLIVIHVCDKCERERELVRGIAKQYGMTKL